MNNLNIPIYRAKKIDSDEYVIGNLIEDEGVFYIIKNPVVTHFNGLQQLTGECEYLDRVDPTILAINLPDMLDSKGNKIFASLSEDGKGGYKMLKGVDMEQYGLKNTSYSSDKSCNFCNNVFSPRVGSTVSRSIFSKLGKIFAMGLSIS